MLVLSIVLLTIINKLVFQKFDTSSEQKLGNMIITRNSLLQGIEFKSKRLKLFKIEMGNGGGLKSFMGL